MFIKNAIILIDRRKGSAAAVSCRGLTLIELLAVLTIIALVAAIAYFSYLEQARKFKRTVAKSTLLDIANRQEQYFFDVTEYADAKNKLAGFTSSSGATILFDDHGSPTTIAAAAFYAATVTATDDGSVCTVPCFQLQAALQNDQVHDSCSTFTIDSDDKRGVNNISSAPARACW